MPCVPAAPCGPAASPSRSPQVDGGHSPEESQRPSAELGKPASDGQAAELLGIPSLPRTVPTLLEEAGSGGPALNSSGYCSISAGKVRSAVFIAPARSAQPECVLSRSVVFDSADPPDCSPPRLLCPWAFLGCRFLLQGISPIQGWDPPLLHLLPWQEDSLPRSHLGSPLRAELALKVLPEPDPFSGATTLLSHHWPSAWPAFGRPSASVPPTLIDSMGAQVPLPPESRGSSVPVESC